MSNLNTDAQVVRIVKKKGHHGGHHGGAWKVAYADFVTAMLALFIVLWIMAQSQSLRQSVAQYFKDPGLLPATSGLLEKSNLGAAMPTPGHSQELQRPAPAPADVVDDQRRLEETKKKIQEMIAQMPELESLKNQIRFQITDEGLRIELMERKDGRFFEVGSTKINPKAKEIFAIIAKELNNLPNHLTIEGHTDSRPYGSQNYTNWELSADRANAARRLMEASGTKPGQVVEVRGYADRRLLDAKDPNDYKNRRVSIIVNYLDKGKKKPIPVKIAPAPAAPPAPRVGPVKPSIAPALPAVKPPPSGKVKAARPGPLVVRGKIIPIRTEAAKAPPPAPKDAKVRKDPLEENLGLQKEILNLAPKFSPLNSK